MYGKLEISGVIESLTGLHIGGGSQFAAIGAVDSVVIKDIQDDLPMIPGSSLKGKLRSLLSKQLSDGNLPKEHNQDDDRIKRLFGHAESKNPKTSRIYFSDIFMNEESREELENSDMDATEIKFENTITRSTGVANPRQIERAIKGIKYNMSLIYNIENEGEIEEDFKLLKMAFKLLQYDYLGANGSRGYGRVDIKDLDVKALIVDEEDENCKNVIESCKNILKEV
ncbi:MAG: type III-A CRISPR-associated RAMP protein Csm3 [Lachnospiraceae bacterium]|jgi:CRISPR-associated RAMP protein, csm3 family|nr:MAG: type III-A CRISPR-associated RAMP protein Csm3 [Lachnospiraceae bacterium]